MINSNARRISTRSHMMEVLQIAVQATLAFLVLTTLLGRFVIQQTSMEPNLHEGQRVVVSKLGSLWSELFVSTAHAAGKQPSTSPAFQRGQIAVFHESSNPSEHPLIKRVIATPGEQVEVRNGSVYINSKKLDEPYLHGEVTSCNEICGPITLGPDEYFMLGDNRPVSRDSRNFGPVHANQFVGRVVLRYWPLGEMTLYP